MKIIPGSSWWWWKADDLLDSRLLVSTVLWCSERQVVIQAYHCGSSDKALPPPHTPPDTALELTVHQTLLCPLLKGAEVKPSAWPARNWHLMDPSLSLSSKHLLPQWVSVITVKHWPPTSRASCTHRRTSPQLYLYLTLLWKTGLECLCLSAQYEFSAIQYI